MITPATRAIAIAVGAAAALAIVIIFNFSPIQCLVAALGFGAAFDLMGEALSSRMFEDTTNEDNQDTSADG